MSKQETLSNTVFELDYIVNSIGCNVETLGDVRHEISLLRQEMDNLDYETDFSVAYFNEIHRKMRVLDHLFYYTMEELKKQYKETSKLSYSVFERVPERQEVCPK